MTYECWFRQKVNESINSTVMPKKHEDVMMLFRDHLNKLQGA